ncbi:MAG: hypothetical protein QNJ45_07990 [Ardenticatenaceae bacterium]|nr:hypothetical protein [Ardenticatenaceae bacterium]
MTLGNLIDWIILIYGVYLIIGVIVRPPLFWDSKRMLRRRELIGDRNTAIMFAVIGLIMIALGGFNLVVTL